MTKPKLSRTQQRIRKRIENSFYRYYGEALSCWADIEHVLCMWFVYACDPTWSTAHSAGEIFSSARSFNGNVGMLEAAWRAKRRNSELSAFFWCALKRTEGYYQFRNTLAHHLTIYIKSQRQVVLAARNDPFFQKGQITQPNLIVAIRNFKKLKQIWLYALPVLQPKPTLTPIQALQRIQLLPVYPAASELSRKQRNKLRQQRLRPRAKRS